jgi:hypothetical protein
MRSSFLRFRARDAGSPLSAQVCSDEAREAMRRRSWGTPLMTERGATVFIPGPPSRAGKGRLTWVSKETALLVYEDRALR